MLDQFLWMIVPYIAFTIFIGGHIYRYQKDQFGWNAKSSEFLEKKQLRLASNLFHFGLIIVLGGHFMGLIIPVGVYESIGITEHQYHILALAGGIPAGIAATVGLILLSYRRITVKRLVKTSTTGDWLTLVFLGGVILSGMSATFFNIDSNGFDYRTTIGPWLRGLLIFMPDPTLMETVPSWFKVHIMCFMGLIAVWPFTRLVHVFSMPIKYLTRNYVVFRKR